MTTFLFKCPHCGIELEADEQHIGAKVSCAVCDYHFVLTQTPPIVLEPVPLKYPDMLESITVGQLALSGMKLVLLKPRFIDRVLNDAQTVDGTKKIFNFRWPLLLKRDSESPVVPHIDGYIRHWKTPVIIAGQEYYLCSQWFEYHRTNLIEWFQSFGVTYDELYNACQSSQEDKDVDGIAVKNDARQNTKPIEEEPSRLGSSFDFEKPEADLTFTKPRSIVIGATETEVKSWRDVLKVVSSALYDEYPEKLLSLRGKRFCDFTKRVCLKSSRHGLFNPCKITNDLWIESNFSAATIVKLSVHLATICEIDLKNIKVFYLDSDDRKRPFNQEETNIKHVEESSRPESFFNFEKPEEDLIFTKPRAIVIGTTETKVKFWRDILRVVSSTLYDEYPETLLSLRGKPFGDFTKRVLLSSSRYDLLVPQPIAKDLWIESNLDAGTIIKLSINLAVMCEIDLKNIKIFYSGPKKTEVSVNQAPDREIASAGSISFRKTVDWSTFHHGITIPIKCHPMIHQHLHEKLFPGKSYPVIIEIAEHEFHANIRSFKFSDKSRKPVIQILWNENSKIAKHIRMAYRETYEAVMLDKNNRDVLTEKFEVKSATQKDHFEFVFSLPSSELNYNIEDKTEVSRLKMVVASILEKRFPNGIRPASIIDANKLKKHFHEETGEEIGDINIPSILYAVGVIHGEKVYAISEDGKKDLENLINHLVAEGNQLFYYDELYDIHADFLRQINIFSSELLKTVLSEISPFFCYYKSYFVTQSDVSVESEILRFFEVEVCLSYEDIRIKLPYAPLNKIQQTLSQNGDFIWVRTGVFTHIDKIEFDKDEADVVRNQLCSEVDERGYISISLLDVSGILERNPCLSESAIRWGLFLLYFKEDYQRRGNIITLKGVDLNLALILEDYCLTKDELIIDELLDFEKEITGSTTNQSLTVACDTMIRINKNTFVRDDKINFDKEAIDYALGLFVHADVIPIRAVTSFTAFPYVDGYQWNLYLLESYCRRFSQQFGCNWISVNSRNTGAIFCRSADFTNYIDILVSAVIIAPIEFNEKNVGDFLFESGYIGMRSKSLIRDVIMQAKILRERKN